MTLFDDTELFIQGTRKQVFDLPDAELMLIDGFFTKQESDDYYEILYRQTQWREYEMEMFEKTVIAPRLVSWHEDATNRGVDAGTPGLTSELNDIRNRVENQTQLHFNAVLLNLYRNGNDSVAWHCDHTEKSTRDPIIASVSFGQTRMFRLRHRFRKDLPQIEIPLHHGSFLLMAGTINRFWQHQVPKTSKPVLPRINLTFRQVLRKVV